MLLGHSSSIVSIKATARYRVPRAKRPRVDASREMRSRRIRRFSVVISTSTLANEWSPLRVFNKRPIYNNNSRSRKDITVFQPLLAFLLPFTPRRVGRWRYGAWRRRSCRYIRAAVDGWMDGPRAGRIGVAVRPERLLRLGWDSGWRLVLQLVADRRQNAGHRTR